MTKFQTAQDKTPRSPHTFDPSLIHQLHDDPEPDNMDTFASSSIDPETALIMKEELDDEMPSYVGIEEALEDTAPTTCNIEERASMTIER